MKIRWLNKNSIKFWFFFSKNKFLDLFLKSNSNSNKFHTFVWKADWAFADAPIRFPSLTQAWCCCQLKVLKYAPILTFQGPYHRNKTKLSKGPRLLIFSLHLTCLGYLFLNLRICQNSDFMVSPPLVTVNHILVCKTSTPK